MWVEGTLAEKMLSRKLRTHNEPRGAQDTNYGARKPQQRPWHDAPQHTWQFPLSFLSVSAQFPLSFRYSFLYVLPILLLIAFELKNVLSMLAFELIRVDSNLVSIWFRCFFVIVCELRRVDSIGNRC